MKKIIATGVTTLLLLIIPISKSPAAGINFDMLEATPVGSWQVREDIETSKKGKQTGTKVRTSMLGTEERNGETHYWIEVAIEAFKINKKGKRKSRGKPTIVKSLVAQSIFKSNGENILGNLGGFGAEMIMQSGKGKPMRMSNSGGMLSGLMKAMGTQMTHDYAALGKETVNVPAGEFSAQKIKGSGNVEMNVIFQKIRVKSDSTVWLSSKVPFGMVRNEATTVTNGKTVTTSSQLIEFGKSGASSQITGTPQDMPEIPAMGDLFK